MRKKISGYLSLISSFNKNKKLKIDLEKLLINCKQHNIEGLLFKIKNDFQKLQKENNQENRINKEGAEYEDNMYKEILKKLYLLFAKI